MESKTGNICPFSWNHSVIRCQCFSLFSHLMVFVFLYIYFIPIPMIMKVLWIFMTTTQIYVYKHIVSNTHIHSQIYKKKPWRNWPTAYFNQHHKPNAKTQIESNKTNGFCFYFFSVSTKIELTREFYFHRLDSILVFAWNRNSKWS